MYVCMYVYINLNPRNLNPQPQKKLNPMSVCV